jgi:hypothetical protein
VAAAEPLGDIIALKIQELHGLQSEPRPLVRIDNRQEAANAPFQFDTAAARLHRKNCRVIPSSSRTALYGLWQIPPQTRQYACPTCRPHADEAEMAKEPVSDYVFGVLSVLDQFGSVIRERGREFRESEEGRQLRAGLDGLYKNLEDRERATLQVVLASLDGLLATIADIDTSLDGGPSRNGDREHSRNGDGGQSRNGDGGPT